MRKIFAYLVTTLTLIAAMIFFVPKIAGTNRNEENAIKYAMEYTGGFEVLYKATSKTNDVKDKEVASTISDGMKKLLDINGVNNSIITVEDGNYVRVNVTSKNQIISDEIRNLLQNQNSYEISFRDSQDNLLATGEEILKDIGASYTGDTNAYGQLAINLNIRNTDLLEDITSQVSSASDTHLVIWVGFVEGEDSYANIETNASSAKKVIYNATVSEALNDEVITVTGNYTEDAAKNTVNLINSGTYKYDLDIVQLKSVKEADAIKNRTLLLISLLVGIVIVLLVMAIFFKLEGLFTIIPVLFSEFLSIYLFTILKGVVNSQVIGAFILANVVMFGLLFMVLNRYKNVLKTNKSPIKAFKEAYKKNGAIILDTSIVILIFAIVTYFLGTNAKNFATYLATSSIAIFVGVYLVERFTMYLTCDIFNKNDKALIVSNSQTSQVQDKNEEGKVKDIDSYTKPAFIGFLTLLGLGLVVTLVMGLALNKPFTYYDDAKAKSTLEIVANQEYFTSEEQVREFFNQEEMKVDLTSVELTNENGEYHIIVKSDSSIAKYEDYLKEQLIEIYGENTDYEENYIVYINDYNPVSVLISFVSTLYTTVIAIIVIALYFALRYKYSYSLAAIVSLAMSIISLVAFYGITRLPINSQTSIAIFIVSAYSLFMLVPFFTRIKEYMNDTKKVYLSYQERVECFKKGRNSIALVSVVTTGILDFICLVTMFFDLSNFSMYLAFIIGSLYVLLYNMVVVPKIWVLVENKRDRRKKTFKNRNISKSKYRSLDEQVFIGIND